jgi:hypothetical protein
MPFPLFIPGTSEIERNELTLLFSFSIATTVTSFYDWWTKRIHYSRFKFYITPFYTAKIVTVARDCISTIKDNFENSFVSIIQRCLNIEIFIQTSAKGSCCRHAYNFRLSTRMTSHSAPIENALFLAPQSNFQQLSLRGFITEFFKSNLGYALCEFFHYLIPSLPLRLVVVSANMTPGPRLVVAFLTTHGLNLNQLPLEIKFQLWPFHAKRWNSQLLTLTQQT